jgi:hypothetical protein
VAFIPRFDPINRLLINVTKINLDKNKGIQFLFKISSSSDKLYPKLYKIAWIIGKTKETILNAGLK